jgi:hypothetical protein
METGVHLSEAMKIWHIRAFGGLDRQINSNECSIIMVAKISKTDIKGIFGKVFKDVSI